MLYYNMRSLWDQPLTGLPKLILRFTKFSFEAKIGASIAMDSISGNIKSHYNGPELFLHQLLTH